MLYSFRFFPLLLASLLLPGPRVWAQDVSAAPAASSSLETFVVARPVPPVSQAADSAVPVTVSVSRPSTSGSAFSSAPTAGGTDVSGNAILTLFPGISGLETGVSGRWKGRAVEARLNPGDWFQHGLSNDPGFVQLGRSDGFYEQSGLRLLTPGRNGTLGMGLYRTDGSRSLVPGVDGLWNVGKTRFTALAGLDGSWRMQSKTRGGKTEADTFAERAGGSGPLLYGVATSTRLSGSSTLFQRAAFRSDGHGLSLWGMGGVQRVGTGLLTLDSQFAPLAGTTLRETTLAFHLPLRQQDLLMSWQQSTFGTQRDRQLQLMTLMPLTRALTGWLGESLAWESGGRGRTGLTLGASYAPAGRWSARAEWLQNRQAGPFPFTSQVRGSLGFQYSRELQVKVLCGPSLLGSEAGTFRPVWGLQITRRFSYRAAPPTGSVQGRVLLDGLTCTQPFGILMDGQEAATTDKAGKFTLSHVTPGLHSISLALAALPADMNPTETDCPVDVAAQRAASVLLHVQHVGQVAGHLDVLADEFGATDPTAAIGVTFADEAGHATTTDAKGNFVLGNLTPGRHVIHLVTGTLPPRYCVLSAAQLTAQVICDRPSPALRFQAAPERRVVQFSDVTPLSVPDKPAEKVADKPAPVTADKVADKPAPVTADKVAVKPADKPAAAAPVNTSYEVAYNYNIPDVATAKDAYKAADKIALRIAYKVAGKL